MNVLPYSNITLPKEAQNAFAGLKKAFFGYLIVLMLTLPFSEAIWMK
jgi:hypothetical protein